VGKLFKILILVLAISAIPILTPRAQTDNALITVLDRSGQSVTRITDGNTLRLEITLPQASPADQTITFTLDGGREAVGACTISAGKDGCQTDPFHALGWHWGTDGSLKLNAWSTLDAGDACWGVGLDPVEPLRSSWSTGSSCRERSPTSVRAALMR
jgi:hypothetical protein